MRKLSKITNSLVPPVLHALVAKLKGRQFYGNYAHWDEAVKECSEFGPEFLEKIKDHHLKVKNGEAAFTRDLTLFAEPQYNWPFLASLFRTACMNDGTVGILDFGGSLGNIYLQHRKLLSGLKIRWCVIDIQPVVEIGKKEFEDDNLVFYPSISDCLANENINLILLSGVLQCLEEPEAILNELLGKSVSTIFVDRTPFIFSKTNDKLLTVQKLPKKFGNARIPHWFFEKNNFIKQFNDNGYQLVAEWQGFDWANLRGTEYKGFIFKNSTLNCSKEDKKTMKATGINLPRRS